MKSSRNLIRHQRLHCLKFLAYQYHLIFVVRPKKNLHPFSINRPKKNLHPFSIDHHKRNLHQSSATSLPQISRLWTSSHLSSFSYQGYSWQILNTTDIWYKEPCLKYTKKVELQITNFLEEITSETYWQTITEKNDPILNFRGNSNNCLCI